MLMILKRQPLAGQHFNALDCVAVARRKNFPRAPRPRVPLTYRITDIGRGLVVRVENAHPIPLKVKPTISRSATCPVSFLQHLTALTASVHADLDRSIDDRGQWL